MIPTSITKPAICAFQTELSTKPDKGSISVHFSEVMSPDALVEIVASEKGPIDLYSWYEGIRGLPLTGARFWRDQIIYPLLARKKDVLFHLFSLKGWDFQKKVTQLPKTTALGAAINRLYLSQIQCIYASEFFKYCCNHQGFLAGYLDARFPDQHLKDLSKDFPKKGLKISEFFEGKKNLFGSLAEWDVSLAYSHMQYVEGFYLVRNSVKNGLKQNQEKLKIAFVLPNDEGKYYGSFPKDLETMLQIEFGNALDGIEIDVAFFFFQFGDSIEDRPYNHVNKERLLPRNVDLHFTALIGDRRNDDDEKQDIRSEENTCVQTRPLLPRDMYHGVNDFNELKISSDGPENALRDEPSKRSPFVQARPSFPRDLYHTFNDF